MSLQSQLYEADEKVQMAYATTGEITRRLRAASVPSSLNFEYDVFLSFRGSDTRKTFTDHLYNALKRRGYRIFRDEDEIEPGENIKSELQEAIRNSRMSVIVLSENYTNSTACLFELQTILKIKNPNKENKRRIISVKTWYETKLIEDIVAAVPRKVSYYRDQDAVLKYERLQKSIARVLAQKADIQAKLHSQMLQMWKRPKKEVEFWLGDVASLKADVQELEQEVFGESRAFSRVDLGKILDEKIREAAELQERGRAFNDNLLVPFPLERPYTEARNAERIREYLRETLSVSVL